MTNPGAALKVLITYAVCIPLAITVGYLLTGPLDWGSISAYGLIAVLMLSPVLIKWHYPLLLVALTCPIYCFFLPGRPPLAQVMVLVSLGIAIIERALNSEKRFVSPPLMVWPLMFTAAMAYFTAKMTGGIGLKAFGGGIDGGVGGGKKYIELFIGIAVFFALTSRIIPKDRRNLYIALFFLGGLPTFFGDLFSVLPSPLNYINLLIPPSTYLTDSSFSWTGRLGAFGVTASVVFNFMLAKYGLRGIFFINRPFRFAIFVTAFCLAMIGGFRIAFATNVAVLIMFFFLEGLHRTKLFPAAILASVLCLGLLIPFAEKLPLNFQRALTIVPHLKLDPQAVMDADGSKLWRENIWQDTWPKVPQYLLVGKGYALTAEDYELMGNGQFAGGVDAVMDRSNVGLAVSGDYHNGPLSTLIPFGIWGAISIVWLLSVALFVTYRNYRYSVPDLRTVNIYFLVVSIWHIISFFFVFGAYSDDVFFIGRTIGFSIALNWGIRRAAARPVSEAPPQTKRRPARQLPLPA